MTWSQNFEFSYHLYGKLKVFTIFNIVNIPKLGISRKVNKNLGESPTERGKRPFVY